MKSIAIITAIRTLNNYGQILQAYALSKYLQNQGYDASLIDFAYDIDWDTIPPISIKSRLKFMMKTSPFYKFIKSRRDKCNFLDFKRKYLRIYPESYPTFKSLQIHPPKTDVYITGSDQIWGNHIQRIEAFFLSFGQNDTKRIAYAPSFGTPTLTEKRISTLTPLIAKYSAVGVREKSGVELCRSLGFKDAEWVPDPTLLLSPNDWAAIGSEKSPFKGSKNRVFIYLIGNDNDERLFRLAQSIPNSEIIIASDNPVKPAGKSYLSLSQWIRAIMDCDYVITNSFHGTMFSLIFNKQFLTFERIGKADHMNVRVRSIAEITGMNNRLVKSDDNIMRELLDSEIDWDSVNTRLKNWQKVGVDFLKKNLS